MLEAAKLLLAKRKKVRINIIGDGPLKTELQEKVRLEQINNVSFLGYIKHKDLFKGIKEGLAVVLPSECYENNPLSVIEAFALGKPVIGSRIGGIPEIVKDHERGLTFEPGNANDLCEKIEFFTDHIDRAMIMGKNARIFVEQELNSEKYYSNLMKIYTAATVKKYGYFKA